MGTTLLLSEFLVTGLIALLSIFFTVLSFFNIYDISAWVQSNNLDKSIPLIVFIILPLSYILGACLYRFLSPDTWSVFIKFFFENHCVDRKEDQKLILIYQNGSDNLVKRIEYIQNLNRLFRNSLLITPLFGVSFTCWITKGWVSNWKAGVFSVMISLVVFCLSAINWLGTTRELSYTLDRATSLLTEEMK
ncbi:hypothetical protein FACHB389_02260 [Nostoc calcicola FACHB-389]|nr:hypothetical protein [Nostoc calcicola FACHB-3891]OKH42224.1 hypothetical protein FACHB389_02260 [Nostoc calcicola FACHB-389]